MGWGRLWRPAGDLVPSELLSASDLAAGLSVGSDLVSISDALVAFATCSLHDRYRRQQNRPSPQVQLLKLSTQAT